MNQTEQTLYEIRTGKQSVRRMPTINEIMQAEDVENFIGNKSRRKARQDQRTVKHTQRAEKKTVRLDLKKARGENIRSKAKSRVILAEQGIVQSNTGGDILNGAKSLISGLTGGNRPQRPDEQPQDEETKYTKPQRDEESTPQATATKPKQSTRPRVEAGVETSIEERTEPTENTTAAEKGEPQKDNTFLYIAAGIALFFIIK